MNVTRESENPTEVTLSILMDSEDEEPFLNRSYRRLANRVRIPGFRPGKAPRSIVESHLGRDALVQEALEFMIPESLDKVLREHEIRAFMEPQLEVLDLEPVSFKAIVPLEPTVDLGDFRSIRLQPPGVDIGDEDVNRVLESLRYESAPWEPAGRPVAFGDLVTMNVRGAVAGEEVINDDGVDYIPQMDNTLPVPGFSVYIEGMTEGQEKEFTLPLPEESIAQGSAASECRFQVEIIAVKEKLLPELDDEFAKGVREGFESMEALSQHIRQRLTEDAESAALRELERNSLEEIKKIATIQASELIYQREMESIREDHQRTLRNQRLDMDTYLRFIGQTEEQWEEQLRPQAEDRLATLLVLRKLAEQEQVEVEPAEVDEEIERLLENAEEESPEGLRRLLNTEDSRESIRSSLLNRKVMARLVEIVKGDAPPDDAGSEDPAGQEHDQEGAAPDEPAPDADADSPDSAETGEPSNA